MECIEPFNDEPAPSGSAGNDHKLLKEAKRLDKEPVDNSMKFYILRTLHLVLKANVITYVDW